MKKNTKVTIYDEINTYHNRETGEIISTSKRSISRRENTPEFTMLFVQGLSILTKSNLTKTQAQVLFELLKYTLNNSNMLMINKDIKTVISKETHATFRTVDASVLALVKKEIIIKKNNFFFLNPLIFGRGNFQNVKKLTQSLEIEYDFENETAIEKATTKTLYNDDQDISQLRVAFSEEKIEDNNIEQIIELETKEKAKDYVDVKKYDDSDKSDKNVLLTKEQNKAKELDVLLTKEQNEAKKLSIKELSLRIEAHKLGL